MTLDLTTIFIGMFFGIIGYGAWRYGKNTQSARHMLLGVALMVFGYIVPSPEYAVLVGGILSILLFWP